MVNFFYHVMMGDTSFGNIFQETGLLVFSENCSFTKEDVDNMVPFERTGYIDMLNHINEERKRMMEEEKMKQKNSNSFSKSRSPKPRKR